MQSNLRIAVFGTGLAWAPHRDSLLDLRDRLDVAWIVGRNIERTGEQAAIFEGARPTTSIDDVLADASVGAALVLTPPHTHLDIVQRLAARGIHVLLEKPLDIDTARARAVVDVCRAHGVTLGVVFQHRMRPAFRHLKQLLLDGALGTLTHALVDVRWWRPQSYYDAPGRGTLARDGGGVLLTQAIHTLDLFLDLAGPVDEVAALSTTSAAHRMECEDLVCGSLRMRNGMLASLVATTAAFPGFAERIELGGTLASATLGGGELRVQWLDGREERCGEPSATGAGAQPMAFGHGPHRALIADFVDAIRERRAPAADGEAGLAVHRLIEALIDSSAARAFVPLHHSKALA
ncbi:Gfo/Idh/MocA family oxidoreductase [Variovorax robiniae]|uniref:Gfo/Idh/MocA family oxidoreductase n=1 Tax=Variovorax robiniae TaxID=1836199 RepID=A0ABU8X7D9_9BURK